MAKIITIGNHKGGVGKTTTAASLGHGLAIRGKAVLLLDLDAQAQLASVLDIKKSDAIYELLVSTRTPYDQLMVKTGRKNLWFIPGSMETANAVAVLRDRPVTHLADKLSNTDFDYIIIDTSPGVSDLQRQAVRAAHYLIVPCAADFLSTEGVFRYLSSTEKVEGAGSLAGVLYKKRALPIAWIAYKGKKGHTTAQRHIQALEKVLPLLPDGSEVVLLGDAELFGHLFPL